jgi:hypothetical protein
MHAQQSFSRKKKRSRRKKGKKEAGVHASKLLLEKLAGEVLGRSWLERAVWKELCGKSCVERAVRKECVEGAVWKELVGKSVEKAVWKE